MKFNTSFKNILLACLSLYMISTLHCAKLNLKNKATTKEKEHALNKIKNKIKVYEKYRLRSKY